MHNFGDVCVEVIGDTVTTVDVPVVGASVGLEDVGLSVGACVGTAEGCIVGIAVVGSNVGT